MTRVRARRLAWLVRPGRDTNHFFDGNTQGMGLIVLEAALALAVLVFLIWWTMFSRRRGGEWHDDAPGPAPGDAPGDPPPLQAPDKAAQASEPPQPPERGGTRKDIG